MAETYPDQPVNVRQLGQEIVPLALPNFAGVQKNLRLLPADTITILVDPLTAPEKASLDGVVAAHAPSPGNAAASTRGAKVKHGVGQSIAASVDTILSFDTEEYNDRGLMHDVAVNNSRLTVRADGRYAVVASVGWQGATGGIRRADVLLNGTEVIGRDQINDPGPEQVDQGLAVFREFVAGDFIELRVRQETVGPLNVMADP
ncbi:MAG: hypothetical protein IH851_13140, partial [Armatimonadetes bacterium]|nr:hypothetical protein [Armatimonadota bacterium]